ncbi:MAG TPA: GntR family transcriptional regulator [Chthoniobacteraceae bacterium]|nr:GntR family transcriptional regulator [Chthoniobacteraceae bacterium]
MMNFRQITNRPLYRQVADAMEEELILPGELKQALPVETELAARYRVSVTTIRKAVDLLEEKGQVRRRQGSGTYIVRNRAARRLALLVDHDVQTENASSVFNRVFKHFHFQVAREGYALTSYFGTRELGSAPVLSDIPEAFLDALRNSQVDGVVAIGSLPLEDWTDLARRNAIPVVGSSRGFESSVCWDDEPFLRLAFETARLNGKRKVAFMAGIRPEVPLNRNYEKVEDLALRLASEYGLETRREWLRSDYSVYLPGAGWELFRDLWRSHREKPDCLITNEFPLADVMDAAIHAGIKPVSELLIVASTSEETRVRYPYPFVRIETGNEAVMARTLLDEVIRRTRGQPPRHLLIPPTGVSFEQALYSQIPALAAISEGNRFDEPILPGAEGPEHAKVEVS